MNNLRPFAFLCSIILSFSLCSAQSGVWTLQRCIERAQTANPDIQQKQVVVDKNAISVKQAQSARLPSLSATIEGSYNWGISPSAEGSYIQQNASVGTAGASFSMPLFSGGRIGNTIKSIRLEEKASMADKEQALQDVTVNVITAYLQLLLNGELVTAAREQCKLSVAQYERTSRLIQTGKIPSSELYESNAQIAKDSSSLVKAQGDVQLAKVDLMQLLLLKDTALFEISPENSEMLPAFETVRSAGVDSLYRMALRHRSSLQAARYRIDKGKADIAVARSGYYPTLDLKANYSNGYYYYYHLPQNVLNSSFIDQYHQNRQEVVALHLQIPIFNGFDVKHRIASAKLDMRQQQLILITEQEQLYKLVQQTCYRIATARANYLSYQQEEEALRKAYQSFQERFEAGKATAFELNEKLLSLSQAIANKIGAKYDYLFSYKTLCFYIGEL